MAESSFVGYVGDPDFHDRSVLDVEHRGSRVQVRVRQRLTNYVPSARQICRWRNVFPARDRVTLSRPR